LKTPNRRLFPKLTHKYTIVLISFAIERGKIDCAGQRVDRNNARYQDVTSLT
jgi:hypothetical protein